MGLYREEVLLKSHHMMELELEDHLHADVNGVSTVHTFDQWCEQKGMGANLI